uniref:Retrovirus-related Pol polyprotein from transposon TNT 1-94-like beta-barrel domain-containing protein n=1 Tax=Micrurus corallinus TaxID=54390 RepID=A0A2D4GRG0_MICCO
MLVLDLLTGMDGPWNADKWLINCGASQTIINNAKLFYRMDAAAGDTIALANDKKAKVIGRGSMQIPCLETRFNNALCVPEMEHNLLSVSSLDKQGFETTSVNGQCLTKKNGIVCAKGIMHDDLHILQGQKVQCAQMFGNVAKHVSRVDLLHRKLGHASLFYLFYFIKIYMLPNSHGILGG